MSHNRFLLLTLDILVLSVTEQSVRLELGREHKTADFIFQYRQPNLPHAKFTRRVGKSVSNSLWTRLDGISQWECELVFDVSNAVFLITRYTVGGSIYSTMTSKVTEHHNELIIQHMENQQELIRKKLTLTFSKVDEEHLWEELVSDLNSTGSEKKINKKNWRRVGNLHLFTFK